MREKFKRFFEENGIQKKWFAEKLGIQQNAFYQILSDENRPMPKKYWKKVVEMTKGYITIEDLAELDKIDESLKDKSNKKQRGK